jgi:uncharacterized protein YwgA
MVENGGFEERVRQSFQKAKEDINSMKLTLESQNNDINDLKLKIEVISKSIEDLNDNLTIFKKNSIGNKGVNNNHQQSSTMINSPKQSQTQKNNLSQSLTFAFQGLTDREFSVFIGIIELTKTLPEVTYTDLANKLNISEPTIRNTVNRLISKKLPVQKTRFFNRKVALSVSDTFQDPKIVSKLVQIRENPHNQQTLLNLPTKET